MKQTLLFAVLIGLVAVMPYRAQDAKELPKGAKADFSRKGRGLKLPSKEILFKRHAKKFAQHDDHIRQLPNDYPQVARRMALVHFDAEDAFGCKIPTGDQGQCGDCFGYSSADVCTQALIIAGKLTVKDRLSSQYGLDCGDFQGGCGGGDEAQVIDAIKSKGFPTDAAYGVPYSASPGSCRNGALVLNKIVDWGYCTPSSGGGVANTADMKAALAKYGPLSVAVDAGQFNNYTAGSVISGNGTSVDHAIICTGWDDTKGKAGAWRVKNQWGADWGEGGYGWMEYGADSIGTEAIWVTAGAPIPPPVPPGPVPPTPPVPPGPGVPVQIWLTTEQVQSVITQSGQITITGDMSLKELMDALDAARAKKAVVPGPWNGRPLPKGP